MLAPIGFLLDLLFGNAFFTFLNKHATLGIGVPAVGGPIPVEEFVFYLTGFMLVLLSYIWAGEYWVRAYNIPDYRNEAQNIPRIAQFHFPSVILGVALIAAAVIYKKLLSSSPDGFRSYFTYLDRAVGGFLPLGSAIHQLASLQLYVLSHPADQPAVGSHAGNPVRLVGLSAAIRNSRPSRR